MLPRAPAPPPTPLPDTAATLAPRLHIRRRLEAELLQPVAFAVLLPRASTVQEEVGAVA